MAKKVCELCEEVVEDYEITVCEKCGAEYCEMCESFKYDSICIECENYMEYEETWQN